ARGRPRAAADARGACPRGGQARRGGCPVSRIEIVARAHAWLALTMLLLVGLSYPASSPWAAPAPTPAPGARTEKPPRTARARIPKVPLLSFQRKPETATTSTYFVGADVHVGDGTVVAGGVVELRGTRIVGVSGPERAASLPAGAQVIDVSGKRIT